MLELAQGKKVDLVYDLGGDGGRIVIAASKVCGCRSVGVEIDPNLVEVSRKETKEDGVGNLAVFVNGDMFEA